MYLSKFMNHLTFFVAVGVLLFVGEPKKVTRLTFESFISSFTVKTRITKIRIESLQKISRKRREAVNEPFENKTNLTDVFAQIF